MPGYSSLFKSVLKYRKLKQDQVKMVLAEKERAVQRLRGHLAKVKRLLKEQEERLLKVQVSEVPASTLRHYHSYLERLRTEEAALLQNLRGELEALHTLHQTLQERAKERLVVEELQAKAYRRFLKELRLREQRFLDEVAGLFHLRKEE